MIYDPAPVDDELLAELMLHNHELKVQRAGFLRQILDPNTRRAALAMEVDVDPEKPLRKFTVDTANYDVQLAHLLAGGTPIAAGQRYGSRTENRYNLQLTLLVATTQPDLFLAILRGLEAAQDIHVTEFSANSLAVLQRDFLFTPTSEQPYNPRLCAYAVRYTRVNAETQTTY